VNDGTARSRAPIPEGTVSTIRGRWQRPALSWTTRIVMGLGLLSVVLPGRASTAVAVVVVAAVVAAPLLRVAWLVHRWRQERDGRFVAAGLLLLGVVGLGALLSILGVGG